MPGTNPIQSIVFQDKPSEFESPAIKVLKMDETLLTRRSELKKKLSHLEWDKKLNQIHFAKDMELTAFRKELETIEKEISGGNDAKIL